jgi:hypothetical protein
MGADALRSRAQRLLALAAMATHVTPAQLDSALAAFARDDRQLSTFMSRTAPSTAEDAPQGPPPLNPHGILLREALHAAGFEAEPVDPRTVTHRWPDHAPLRFRMHGHTLFYHGQHLFWADTAGRIGEPLNGDGSRLLPNKQATKDYLAARGIPVPLGARFFPPQLADALTYAAHRPGELCVKPDNSANGVLVSPGLRDAEEVAAACATAARCCTAFLVESHVYGEAWRFFYVEPAVVAVKVGRPAHVVGDGHSTVEALVAEKDAHRHVRLGDALFMPLPHGREAARVLRRQGYTLQSVPEAGEAVFLSLCSNGSQGAESLTLAERLHPGYVEVVTQALRTLPGVRVAAADVLVADPSIPPSHDNYAVVEVNTAPALVAFHHPWEGPLCNVAGAMVGLLDQLCREQA